MLRKGVYPYDYIDDWEKFNEATFGRCYCIDFQMKHLCEYHDLYLKSDALLLGDVFKNFKKMCSKIYHLDLVKFISAPELAWQAIFKKIEVNLELLTDIDMLLLVKKCIRGGICHVIHQYAKANNKFMKDYDKNKESSYLKFEM